VLIVDDEDKIRSLVGAYFRSEGFEVREAADGETALEMLADVEPDLVILDVMLPGIDGVEVLRRIRVGSDTFVIMLTARAEETDRLIGLAVGADDYVTKPFSPREVVARAKAMLRRGRSLPGSTRDDVLAFHHVAIDRAGRKVSVDGDPVELTTLEFDLLGTLASAPGRVFTRRQLIQRVWGYDFFGDERVVDVHIGRLRKALGDDATTPNLIGTVRGVGYRFLDNGERP
jgi:DNA-binding response OmpR family regulator